MKDLDAILRARAHARGPCVLATVVAVSGSSYRKPGARMLMGEDGWLAGGVSGGCLETDIVRKAFFRTSTAPCVLRYDSTGEGTEDEGGLSFALGCNGIVDVLLERFEAGAEEALSFAAEARNQGKRAVVATVYEGSSHGVGTRWMLREDGVEAGLIEGALGEAVRAAAHEALAQGRTWSGPCGDALVLMEVVEPPHSLVLFGSGFDVVPVVTQATGLGWRVTVVADRPKETLRRRFPLAHSVVSAKARDAAEAVRLTPRSLVVLMTHSLPQDQVLLADLLPRSLRYLGVLGPRARTEKLLAAMSPPPGDMLLEKLHAPVGLDLGAEGAEEIALSIVAELQAIVSDRVGGKLRERNAPIHTVAPPPARKLA
ncbi:XdhC family protein [Myxococcus stipitatus]|uniref:XdhC family protein n=1 Tax=Myxococcus stipitatus TaxID=83455 RepID=UPI00314513E1